MRLQSLIPCSVTLRLLCLDQLSLSSLHLQRAGHSRTQLVITTHFDSTPHSRPPARRDPGRAGIHAPTQSQIHWRTVS